jgi:hypothetical protein
VGHSQWRQDTLDQRGNERQIAGQAVELGDNQPRPSLLQAASAESRGVDVDDKLMARIASMRRRWQRIHLLRSSL